MDILELIDNAKANGGGTYKIENWDDEGYEFSSLTLSEGYYVSLAGGMERVSLTLSALDEAILGFDYQTERLGLWRDEDGKWSIDRTVWISSRETAIDLGTLERQRAIWDIAAQQAITI